MISETAYFVKDVIGPREAVSIVAAEAQQDGKSDSIAAHTKTELLRLHDAALDSDNEFVAPDEWISMEDEPGHQELCNREQAFFSRPSLKTLIFPALGTMRSIAYALRLLVMNR